MSPDFDDEGPPAERGAPAWLITFGDLMSLLLTFFVLLLSFAQMDVVKFAAAADSLRDSLGSGAREAGPAEWLGGAAPSGGAAIPRPLRGELPFEARPEQADLLRRLERMIAAHELEKLVEAERTPRGVVVRVQGSHLFDPGSAQLRPEGLLVLDEIAGLLKQVGNDVAVEGHTDDAPVATAEFPSNWHLSAGRAIAALQYLVEAAGVDARRLSAAGYANLRPRVPNASPELRALNRRVEFVFLRPLEEERRSTANQPQDGA